MHIPPAPSSPARPADLLLSPLLLASLALLVVNDWVLKPAFHNAVTGKLSDFAGVAALALCLRALLPARRMAACVLAGAAFALWKSPAAQPLIDTWNALGGWTVGRVVDGTDLVALLVLPLAYRHRPPRVTSPALRRVLAPPVAAGCMLAFAATSYIRLVSFPGDAVYTFPDAPEALLMRMYDLRVGSMEYGVPRLLRGPVDTLEIHVGADEMAGVQAELRPAEGGSTVRLLTARAIHGSPFTAEAVRRAFEAQVVEPLRRNLPDTVGVEGITAGPAAEAMRPRVRSPRALYEPRDTVRVSVAQPAYLAVMEITPQQRWQVIFPVTDADERHFPAGEHALVTACAGLAPAAPVPPGRDVPACGVARRVTMDDVRALEGIRYDPCKQAAPAQGSRLASGSLVVIAAPAPIRRAALEEAVADRCIGGAWYPVEEVRLGALLTRMGAREWALAEVTLRR